jgi:manganese transport protein
MTEPTQATAVRRPVAAQPGRRAGGFGVMLGPAFIAAVAFIDPGNVATNVLAGARYGYLLLWVVVGASALAMLVQYLAAKLGTATGQSLPEVCHRFPRGVRLGLWAQAEVIVIMTDLAEVVGGAIALNMLFGVPVFAGGVIMTVAVFVILALQIRGQSTFRAVVIVLLAVVVATFVLQAARAGLNAGATIGGLMPRTRGTGSLVLVAAIIGATVMPHVIYLHSSLCQEHRHAHSGADPQGLLRFNRRDVLFAMSLAGVANAAILLAATVLPYSAGESLSDAYRSFATVLGPVTALAFGIALLASSLASSLVGVYSGQTIMQGFLDRSVPVMVRRVVSAVPPLLILAVGVDATHALVLSQVALSIGIPFALIPLILFTRNRSIMGDLVNQRRTTVAATCVTTLVIVLNLVLLVATV